MCFIKKLLFIVPILLFLQCRKPNSTNWDVDLVFPVVNSQLNIKNFLGDSIFKTDNTGLLSLSLTRTITAIKLDSLIKLPDTTIVNTFNSIFPIALQPGLPLTFFPPSELTFSVGNGVALKTVDIKNGLLNVKFSNSVAEPLDLIYIIKSATKNGVPLTIFETIPTGTNSLIKTYNLAGYSLDLRGLNGNVYNTIAQTYTVSLNPGSPSLTTGFNQGASVELSYSNIVPQYVEGYFGQQTVALPLDTARIDIINNFEAKNFMLSDATFNFNIFNQFGAEFTSNLFNIKSIHTNTVVPLNTTQLSNININRASKVGNTLFQTVKSVSLNATNSNIAPFLSVLPNKLTYQGSIQVNPLGNVSGYNDFAFYNTGINVTADINIPMRFSANYFKLTSTTAVDFTNVNQLDRVNYGNIILSASNGYPFSAQLQAYMLDENKQIIDSLFTSTSNTLVKGITNAQNVVTSPTKSRVAIPINKTKIDHLRKTKWLKIISYMLMPPNPPEIKLYENYSFDVNIIAELNYNAKLN